MASSCKTVPVFDWLLADGKSFGCCTEVELRYHQAQGTAGADDRLGEILCYEPASEDERRKIAWANERTTTPTAPKST